MLENSYLKSEFYNNFFPEQTFSSMFQTKSNTNRAELVISTEQSSLIRQKKISMISVIFLNQKN
jgi:hypothetical protein